MTFFRRRLLFKLYMFSDICIFIAALLAAAWISHSRMNHITWPEFFSLRISISTFIVFIGMIFFWHFLFNSYQLYRSQRLNKGSQEWKDILKATTSGTAIFIIIGHIFRIDMFTSVFMMSFWFSSTIFTVLFRRALRYALNKVRLYGRNLRYILIVGTNQRAYDFAHMIEQKRELGYRVIGYVDNDVHLSNGEVKLLGSMESFPAIMRSHVIDEVVVTLPVKSCYEEIQVIIQQAEEQGITIRYLSDLFGTKITRLKGEMIDDFSIMTMTSRMQDDWQRLAKRITDVILASVLIVLSFPVMVFVMITIKVTSPGPVFFVHKRVGQNKRQFRLYKFRTMLEGAEEMQPELETLNEMDGPVFKIKNDPRITKIGRWLRRTSIDELPQLFNVIKGDMSLVGPRPLPVRDYDGFNKDWQRRRFSVPPGITCIWQISGRNGTAFEKWMKMDMEYIDNWKLSSDFKILLKTIPAVLKGKGAS